MDWSKLELTVYASDAQKANGLICQSSDQVLHPVSAVKKGGSYVLEQDPFSGKVKLNIEMYSK